MAAVEIISYGTPFRLSNYLNQILQSGFGVPSPFDLFNAFIDRSIKSVGNESICSIFLDAAIQIVATLDITLCTPAITAHHDRIVNRLTAIIADKSPSTWLSMPNDSDHHDFTILIFRYIVRSSTFSTKVTRARLSSLVSHALVGLHRISPDHDRSPGIYMELGEFYLSRRERLRSLEVLTVSRGALSSHQIQSVERLIPVVCVYSGHCWERTFQNPDERVTDSRLAGLIHAANGQGVNQLNSGFKTIFEQAFDCIMTKQTSHLLAFDIRVLFLFQATFVMVMPPSMNSIIKAGISMDDMAFQADQLYNRLAGVESTLPMTYSVKRLKLWINQIKEKIALSATGQIVTKHLNPEPVFDEIRSMALERCRSESDIINTIYALIKSSNLSKTMLDPLLTGSYSHIAQCASCLLIPDPALLLQCLYDPARCSTTILFAVASPSISHTIAALLARIIENFDKSRSIIAKGADNHQFTSVKPRQLVASLQLSSVQILPRLLPVLRQCMLASTSLSDLPLADHIRSIASIAFAEQDYRSSTRLLLASIRAEATTSLSSTETIADAVWLSMLVTSLAKSNSPFEAAVLSQFDKKNDLTMASNLLQISCRRHDPKLFKYIAFPELIEVLVYCHGELSPHESKRQAAIEIGSHQIMTLQNGTYLRILELRRILEAFLVMLMSSGTFLDYGVVYHHLGP